MKITDNDIISNDIKLIETGLPKSDDWFDDGDSLNVSDYATFSMNLGTHNIEYRFYTSVKLIAECKRSLCKGDGYITPDSEDIELSYMEIELDEAYSEDADIEFNLENPDVLNKLKSIIESNV